MGANVFKEIEKTCVVYQWGSHIKHCAAGRYGDSCGRKLFSKHEGKKNGAKILQFVTLQAGHTYWLFAQIYQETANSLFVGFMEKKGRAMIPNFRHPMRTEVL